MKFGRVDVAVSDATVIEIENWVDAALNVEGLGISARNHFCSKDTLKASANLNPEVVDVSLLDSLYLA
jgi:hypothetical protein